MKYEADADGKILWIDCVICGTRMIDKGGFWECPDDGLSTNPDIPAAYCEHLTISRYRCLDCGGLDEKIRENLVHNSPKPGTRAMPGGNQSCE